MAKGGSDTVRTPLDDSMTKVPSGEAVTCPRAISSTSPPASTTVRPSTHGRTVPYLNVAAPAAQVATTPPTNAPM